MANMKSLADQIREELKHPTGQVDKPARQQKSAKSKAVESPLLSALYAWDNSGNKSMVHVRFDEKTVRLMNQFKMATDVDVTKLVAFSIKHLFDNNPELKQIIKHFIQNTDL